MPAEGDEPDDARWGGVVEPMSDRRTVLLVVAVLVALLGAAVVVVALIALQDPVGAQGDLGTLVDRSDELRVAGILGSAIVLGGLGTAVALVRAQLRARRG